MFEVSRKAQFGTWFDICKTIGSDYLSHYDNIYLSLIALYNIFRFESKLLSYFQIKLGNKKYVNTFFVSQIYH